MRSRMWSMHLLLHAHTCTMQDSQYCRLQRNHNRSPSVRHHHGDSRPCAHGTHTAHTRHTQWHTNLHRLVPAVGFQEGRGSEQGRLHPNAHAPPLDGTPTELLPHPRVRLPRVRPATHTVQVPTAVPSPQVLQVPQSVHTILTDPRLGEALEGRGSWHVAPGAAAAASPRPLAGGAA